jgi:hypothetical protein
LPPVLVLVALDKSLKVRGDFRHLHIATPTDFVANIFRDIARPAIGRTSFTKSSTTAIA